VSLRSQWRRITSPEIPESRRERVPYQAVRVALLVALAVVTYALFPSAPAVETPLFEVGAVASENVIAPFAFRVRKSPADLAKERDELAATAKPIFVYAPAALDSSLRALETIFRDITRAVDDGDPATAARRVQQVAARHGLTLTDAEAQYLTFRGRRLPMRDGLERVLRRWLAQGIASSGATDDVRGEVIVRRNSDERNVLADSIVTFANLIVRARRFHPDPNSSIGDGLYYKLLSSLFRPTIVLDRAATERRRQELRASVSEWSYEVREGEKIVGEHEVVGREEHDKLRALQVETERRIGGERAIGRVLGAVLYNALVLTIFAITIVLFRPQLYRSFRALALIAIVFAVVLAAASVFGHLQPVRPELVPIPLAAVMLSILFDARISLIAAMILAVLVGGQGVFRGTNALFLGLVGGAAAAIAVQVLRRREQIVYGVLTIFGAFILADLALGLVLDWPPRDILVSIMWGGANALGSVALAMFLLPVAERLTGVTTDLTLLEYSNLNHQLLRRLMMEAPGTFDHTMRMANLVEAACNAVGANGLLGRVGTYFHDIGKLGKPQYFVENQPKGRNPHDKLKPSASAQIIRGHIRDGLELAAEHRIPRAIAAFIPEHHGTLSIAYFLEKAKERDPVLNTMEYTYPGPIPQSAETAVCMLADGVEASARVLSDPTPEKIREVIDHIVRLRIDQGQLRDAPLTQRQIEIVKEQFARVLTGNYHSRIEYPARSGGVTSEFASA
jgi:putative nucleotidyltransferase with HDIG domain